MRDPFYEEEIGVVLCALVSATLQALRQRASLDGASL